MLFWLLESPDKQLAETYGTAAEWKKDRHLSTDKSNFAMDNDKAVLSK